MSNSTKLPKPKVDDDSKEMTFDYGGETYTVPTPKLWPLEAGDAEESGRPLESLKIILGPKQYKLFRSVPRTLGDAEDIMTAMFDAAELDRGE